MSLHTIRGCPTKTYKLRVVSSGGSIFPQTPTFALAVYRNTYLPRSWLQRVTARDYLLFPWTCLMFWYLPRLQKAVRVDEIWISRYQWKENYKSLALKLLNFFRKLMCKFSQSPHLKGASSNAARCLVYRAEQVPDLFQVPTHVTTARTAESPHFSGCTNSCIMWV